MTRHRARKGVRAPYTFPKLKRHLLAVHDPNSPHKSLRGLARKYGVSHAVIHRILNGKEPSAPEIRKRLGLVAVYASAPVCARCGRLHVAARCTRRRPGPRRRVWQRCAMDVWSIIWGQKKGEQ